MKTLFRKFLEDESAATAIEYGILAASIFIVILPFVNAIGAALKIMFGNVRAAIGP